MAPDRLEETCDRIIASLLKVKRGEVDDEELVEYLEAIKDSTDVLIRLVQFEVPHYGK